eukprot:Platyproteum_vivax@DN7628_c0_g1_i15.p1
MNMMNVFNGLDEALNVLCTAEEAFLPAMTEDDMTKDNGILDSDKKHSSTPTKPPQKALDPPLATSTSADVPPIVTPVPFEASVPPPPEGSPASEVASPTQAPHLPPKSISKRSKLSVGAASLKPRKSHSEFSFAGPPPDESIGNFSVVDDMHATPSVIEESFNIQSILGKEPVEAAAMAALASGANFSFADNIPAFEETPSGPPPPLVFEDTPIPLEPPEQAAKLRKSAAIEMTPKVTNSHDIAVGSGNVLALAPDEDETQKPKRGRAKGKGRAKPPRDPTIPRKPRQPKVADKPSLEPVALDRRSSSRMRMPPLDWWASERFIYERAPGTVVPVVVGVLTCTDDLDGVADGAPPPPKNVRKAKAKQRKKAADFEEEPLPVTAGVDDSLNDSVLPKKRKRQTPEAEPKKALNDAAPPSSSKTEAKKSQKIKVQKSKQRPKNDVTSSSPSRQKLSSPGLASVAEGLEIAPEQIVEDSESEEQEQRTVLPWKKLRFMDCLSGGKPQPLKVAVGMDVPGFFSCVVGIGPGGKKKKEVAARTKIITMVEGDPKSIAFILNSKQTLLSPGDSVRVPKGGYNVT